MTHSTQTQAAEWQFSFLSFLALCGLTSAAIVHFGSYARTTIAPGNPLFFILHLGIFPLFFLMIVRLKRWSNRQSWIGRSTIADKQWKELKGFFPAWVFSLVPILGAYVFINFFLSLAHLPGRGTQPTPEEGIYVVRAFSGHWLIFYALPTLFFGFVPANARPSRDQTVSP